MDFATIARTAWSVHGASQSAEELERALELVYGAGIVVEIGCDQGGTLWAWKQVAGRVLGITLEDNSYTAGGSGRMLNDHDLPVFVGDSHSTEALEWLVNELDGERVDVLVIDGDHSVSGVWADLVDYRPLVRDGGLILLHDIFSMGDERCQVWKVWPEVRGHSYTEIAATQGPRYGWGVIHLVGGAA